MREPNNLTILLLIVAWGGFGVGYLFRKEREKMIEREKNKRK